MSEDFRKFHRRMLVSKKTEADAVTCICAILFVYLIFFLVPDSSCAPLLSHDEFGFNENFMSACQNAQWVRLEALVWIGLSLLRLLFLTSAWQAGPILKMHGLKIERRDGKPVTLRFAARYALWEWLPFHVMSVHILIFGMPASLYGSASIVIPAVTAQMLWLAPVIFKYQGMNIAEFLTGARIVFSAKAEAKIKNAYQKKWKKHLSALSSFFSYGFYPLTIAIFVFFTVQILRAPDIHPAYERALYADWEPVWEDNLYFAMEGVIAPAEITDFYAYGRARALLRFRDYERLKGLAGIPYAYEIPEQYEPLSKIEESNELEFKSEDWKSMACLYSLSFNQEKPCARKQDVQSYIQSNRVIWDRFNSLPDYSIYNVPPQLTGGKFAVKPGLAELKAVQIITLAEGGNAEEAFLEWIKYMKLYRAMAGAKETLVFKAVVGIDIRIQLKALEKLLYLHPELARSHGAEIIDVLEPTGNALFRTEFMLQDDIGLVEPSFLGLLGNVNAIRNDLYDCILGFQELARLTVYDFPFGQPHSLCQRAEQNKAGSIMVDSLMEPGFVVPNTIWGLLVGGLLKGQELIESWKLFDIELRMASLAVKILGQDIKPDDIPAFLASAPKGLQNPLTQKPFEWDADEKALFFESPISDQRTEFRLNLQGR